MFARRYSGTVIDVWSLNGGFSKSRVLKVVVSNAAGGVLITSAAKVSPLVDITEERGRYDTQIARLLPGGYPALSVVIDAGAGEYGGLFYGMVGKTVETLFRRIADAHPSVPQVPARLLAQLRRLGINQSTSETSPRCSVTPPTDW